MDINSWTVFKQNWQKAIRNKSIYITIVLFVLVAVVAIIIVNFVSNGEQHALPLDPSNWRQVVQDAILKNPNDIKNVAIWKWCLQNDVMPYSLYANFAPSSIDKMLSVLMYPILMYFVLVIILFVSGIATIERRSIDISGTIDDGIYNNIYIQSNTESTKLDLKAKFFGDMYFFVSFAFISLVCFYTIGLALATFFFSSSDVPYIVYNNGSVLALSFRVAFGLALLCIFCVLLFLRSCIVVLEMFLKNKYTAYLWTVLILLFSGLVFVGLFDNQQWMSYLPFYHFGMTMGLIFDIHSDFNDVPILFGIIVLVVWTVLFYSIALVCIRLKSHNSDQRYVTV
ncbi:MAG: hypothetical protein FWF56_00530 [Firmicutes bacterium]|nr:hypothetical protein [Bacillota bacterium]MCL1953754.1 hypothetical protein [Bacillota bacterium]